MGGFIGTIHEKQDVILTITYPEASPIKLVLNSKLDEPRPHEITRIPYVVRRHPVYRVLTLEQNEFRLSLRQVTASPDSLEENLRVPLSRTTAAKTPITVSEDPVIDDSTTGGSN